LKQVTIDMPAIKDIAVRGVRRAALFMGLGVNAAKNPDFKQYQLGNLTGMEFIEPITKEEVMNNVKTEFGRWIVGNGLRELVESFSSFLDQIYSVCLLMDYNTGQIAPDKAQKMVKAFMHDGMEGKLERLKSHLGIEIERLDCLASINQARNCLTHRRGIVGPKDCGEKTGKLNVKWMGIETYAELHSGERVPLYPMPEAGVILEKDGRILFQITEHSKGFLLGSTVDLSPRDLAEICQFILKSTDEVVAATSRFAADRGVPHST
jgi:hypothetical protein